VNNEAKNSREGLLVPGEAGEVGASKTPKSKMAEPKWEKTHIQILGCGSKWKT
jgi:hypothetical protein